MSSRRLRLAGVNLALAACALAAMMASPVKAADAPAEIKIGTLYASSGTYAGISTTINLGLKIWIDQKNAEGGVYVKPFDRKIPIRLVSYDDQSNTATAATLYNQLITQDKVDLLVADSGSVLTSVAVPIAREHKMFLFDQTGTGAAFFTKDNPYIALMSIPASNVWPRYLGDFLTKTAPSMGIKKVALLYSTNDFTGTQATTIRNMIKASGALEIVYDEGVPTSNSNYSVLINNIVAAEPDAVIELGYPGNDTAFLRNLQDSGERFKFLFCLYPGIEPELLEKNVGAAALEHIFTYVMSSSIAYKPNFGLPLQDYKALWTSKTADKHVEFGFNSVAGYNTGLVIEKALGATASLDQLDIRKAVFAQSGKLTTLAGPFELNEEGAQVGMLTPIGQIEADGKGETRFVVVYPPDLATGKPIYPATK